MRIVSQLRRRLAIASITAAILPATAARAQHASDNPVTAAGDAYGLTLGLESVGLYNPELVRGFNPQTAGNVRIDGLYFDQQGALSERVVEGSAIRVGLTEIGYAFPAPTGIVDYDLRGLGGDKPSATIIANVGPYEAWGVSVDGALPFADKRLVVPIGASTQLSSLTPFGYFRGYTSRITSVGATPEWSPTRKITVRAIIDWQQSSAVKTFPLFFTAGDFLPPPIPTGYLGQHWAQGRNVTVNLGGIVSAQLTGAWSLKAGVFRSTNDYPVSFADLYVGTLPDGRSDHVAIGYPDQSTSSNSGEARLTGAFTSGDWRQRFIFMARGRDTTARYGGGDVADLGPAMIGAGAQTPQPDFRYSARSTDHAKLWSVGFAYRADWRKRAELEIGVQREDYRESASAPGAPGSAVSARPVRFYGNAAFALAHKWTWYVGYTQGLENSGVAPSNAANSGAVLPASLTWQADTGVRYEVTSKFKIIAGVFELQKPYFNLDSANVDRELGVQKAKGLEISIAGEPIDHLHVNIGVLDGRVSIVGADLAAERVGSTAVGQPHVSYVANIDYSLPWAPAASLDAAITHFGTAAESVDNGVFVPAVTQVNLGGRYRFTALGRPVSLRVQVQNVLGAKAWASLYTPGFFQWPGPRTVFAYITTDF